MRTPPWRNLKLAMDTLPSLSCTHNTSYKRPSSLLSRHRPYSPVSFRDIPNVFYSSECLDATDATTTYCVEYKRLAPAASPACPMPILTMFAVVFMSGVGGWLWRCDELLSDRNFIYHAHDAEFSGLCVDTVIIVVSECLHNAYLFYFESSDYNEYAYFRGQTAFT